MTTRTNISTIYRIWHLPTLSAYIGKTSMEPGRRLWLFLHSGPGKKIDTNADNWCIELVAQLEGLDIRSKELERAEQGAIDFFLSQNARSSLLNKTTFAEPGKAEMEHRKLTGKKLSAYSSENGRKYGRHYLYLGSIACRKHCKFFHLEYGIREADAIKHFAEYFGIHAGNLGAVGSGKRNQCSGWRLPVEGEDYCQL